MKNLLKTLLITIVTFITINTSTVMADDDCDNCDGVSFCIGEVCYLCTDDMGCIVVSGPVVDPQ